LMADVGATVDTTHGAVLRSPYVTDGRVRSAGVLAERQPAQRHGAPVLHVDVQW